MSSRDSDIWDSEIVRAAYMRHDMQEIRDWEILTAYMEKEIEKLRRDNPEYQRSTCWLCTVENKAEHPRYTCWICTMDYKHAEELQPTCWICTMVDSVVINCDHYNCMITSGLARRESMGLLRSGRGKERGRGRGRGRSAPR